MQIILVGQLVEQLHTTLVLFVVAFVTFLQHVVIFTDEELVAPTGSIVEEEDEVSSAVSFGINLPISPSVL